MPSPYGSSPSESGAAWDVADPVASVVGALAGVAALAYALVAPLDTEHMADRLAREVVRREQDEYVRWLDGSVGGRIDLAYTVRVHGQVDGAPAEGRLSDLTALHGRLSPPRMVITGGDGADDAGTGKSLAALSMVLDLARDREAGRPSPCAWPPPHGRARSWRRGSPGT
ncbi:hypothetical protein STANM309S_02896 [Streptomyces tanashiensis]